ncbi:MAG: class 1 fructose-bisphosphatase [Alphaproteobacteria bacterium]|nr:class 1 fructose-bisphosphatase [Alphaproteobacteria bacterium]
MMRSERTTLTEFLIAERRRFPHATGELNALILEVSLACKAIASRVEYGELVDRMAPGSADKPRRSLPAITHDLFVEATEWGGHVAGMVSREQSIPIATAGGGPPGNYLLIFDALDGSSNCDVNATLGSLFSILRMPTPGDFASTEDYLQPGDRQVCAGYAIYGPATMLVLSVGTGVHGFTLEPRLGEFILTHSGMRIAGATDEFAIDTSNSRFWEPAVKRYVDECVAGANGPRGRDFAMRWVASLVAETHRILIRGGVFLDPRADPALSGLRLLHEANPVAFLVHQAGGAATTGRQRVLDIVPDELDQRVGLIFGASDEIERIEAYHRSFHPRDYDAPLFGMRGLFRDPR